MNRRSLVSIGALVLGIAVVLSATIAAQAPAAAGQARARGESPSADGKAYTPPKTPDGQPDLQGFWTNSTYVPLERPQGVTKEFYTPDEARGRDQSCGGQGGRADRAGTTADVHYDFSQFGLDRSQSKFAPESAHVADRRSTGREDSAGQRAGTEARGRARGSEEGCRWSVRLGAEHADRIALHYHGRRQVPR